MGEWMVSKYLSVRSWLADRFTKACQDETGEVNIVAIVLLIVVVIAIVAIFQDRLTAIVNSLFDQIQSQI